MVSVLQTDIYSWKMYICCSANRQTFLENWYDFGEHIKRAPGNIDNLKAHYFAIFLIFLNLCCHINVKFGITNSFKYDFLVLLGLLYLHTKFHDCTVSQSRDYVLQAKKASDSMQK